jgi:hypothetical protein
MEGSLGFLEIKAVPFGSADDGGEGYFLMTGLPQSVFVVAVIVRLQRDFLILNDLPFDG